MKINKWARIGEKVLLKDLQKGDVFVETGYGEAEFFVMKEDPTETEPGAFRGVGVNSETGAEVDFLQRMEYLHYGPSLYRYLR